MGEEKPERLGVKGTLALYGSALRLLGAANTTGLIAAGAAFHVFDKNTDLRVMAVIFLVGIIAFGVGYIFWVSVNIDLDHALQESGDDTRVETLFPFIKERTAEFCLRSAKQGVTVMYAAALISLVCFCLGLLAVLRLAVGL